jgi:hypothetical protein
MPPSAALLSQFLQVIIPCSSAALLVPSSDIESCDVGKRYAESSAADDNVADDRDDTHNVTINLRNTEHTRNNKSNRRVSFSTVEVREYHVVIGDYRLCWYPLSLDWKFHSKTTLWGVDDFDKIKQLTAAGGRPRCLGEKQRQDRLQTMGSTQKELMQCNRRRKIILAMDHAYGLCNTREAKKALWDMDHYVV